MKCLPVLRSGIKTSLGCLFIAGVALGPVAAQDAAKEQFLQNKADQVDVRTHTAAVTSQIQSLIDELAANGISGDDAKVLQATKAALSNLSSKEMERVITALQNAGQAPTPVATKTNALKAYTGQKGIIMEFQLILKDYQQRQAAYELPVRFKELTDKQTETLTTTADIARTSAGLTALELSTMDSTTQQIVQSDQESLVNEVNLAKQQLDAAVQGGSGDDIKPLLQAQQDLNTGKLQKALAQANDKLKAGKLLEAITQQQIAEQELHHITRDLNLPASLSDALAQAAEDLDKLIDEQKKLLGETQGAINGKVEMSSLGDRQGGLVLEANMLQQDILALSSTAASLVGEAITPPMQASRAQLANTGGYPTAAKAQESAITKLEEAQKQLQQELAAAQKAQEEANKDPVAQLQDLQKQIQAAMQQQQQTTAQTAQALNNAQQDPSATAQVQQQQGQVQQQTAGLQQTALPLSMAAAQALANAADQMNQAQQAMATPANATNAPADQQAAQAALAQANAAVGQQIAQDQQQAADPSALAAAANDIQQAQDEAGSANADAAPQAGTPDASTPQAGTPQASTPQAGAPDMAQAAAALAQAAQDANAAAATPGLPDAAASAVADAQADIGQGEADAGKGDAPGTAAAAAAAENALAQAGAAVAMAEAGMEPGKGNQPGNEPGNQPGPPSVAGWAKMPPGHDGRSLTGAKTIGGGSLDQGTLHNTTGLGKNIALQARDREVIDQSQGEKRPQEYAPLIDQYMKNLADQSTSSAQ